MIGREDPAGPRNDTQEKTAAGLELRGGPGSDRGGTAGTEETGGEDGEDAGTRLERVEGQELGIWTERRYAETRDRCRKAIEQMDADLVNRACNAIATSESVYDDEQHSKDGATEGPTKAVLELLAVELEAALYGLAGAMSRDHLCGARTPDECARHIDKFRKGEESADWKAGTLLRRLLPTALRRVQAAQRGWDRYYPGERTRPWGTTTDEMETVLIEAGRPLDTLEIEQRVRTSGTTVRLRLQDPRFRRVAKSRWALTVWGLPEYRSIADSLETLIEIAGGELDADTAVRIVARRHDVQETSINAAMDAQGFSVDKHGRLQPPRRRPERTRSRHRNRAGR